MKRIEAFLKAMLVLPLLLVVLAGIFALLVVTVAGCAALSLLVLVLGAVATILLPLYALACPEDILS